jgi:hypothetical protein
MTTSPKKTTVVIPIHNSSSTLIDSIMILAGTTATTWLNRILFKGIAVKLSLVGR